MGDPLVRRWLNMPARPADTDFDAPQAHRRDGWIDGDRYDYVVAATADDVAVGAVVASKRHRDNWELAYFAGEAGRGRGLMSQAVRALCEALFAHGVGRLEMRTHPANAASQRVARRVGFVREGRRAPLDLATRPAEDALVWSLLPDDPR